MGAEASQTYSYRDWDADYTTTSDDANAIHSSLSTTSLPSSSSNTLSDTSLFSFSSPGLYTPLGADGWNAFEDSFSPVVANPTTLSSSYGDDGTPLYVEKDDQSSWLESDDDPQSELSNEPQPSSMSLERHTGVKSSATSIKSTHRVRSSTSSQTLRSPPRHPASTKLRTAKALQTFKSKKTASPKSLSTDDTHRTRHNNVEKQYRMRMNSHFENLLATIPEDVIRSSGSGASGAVTNVTRAETLTLAIGYIKKLERQEKELSLENKILEADVARFKKEFVSRGGVLLP